MNCCFLSSALAILLAGSSDALAGKLRSELQLMADLAPTNSESVILDCLDQVINTRDSGTILQLRVLLTDSRSEVRRRAAYAFSKVGASATAADLKAICAMLKATEPDEVEDCLDVLRRLKARAAVPEILLVLKSDNAANVRDACQTLALLADQDAIPHLEPLLQHKSSAVRKDAKAAITTLQAKPVTNRRQP